MAFGALPKRFHAKTRVIYQSAEPYRVPPPRAAKRTFQVCLIGHLREEKDPLRAAMAVRRLPPESRIQILHIGLALDARLERQARAEAKRNSRYRWVGELSHRKTRRILAGSDLAVITSRMEGSSNVLSEALASSVPVVVSKIPGLMGTLGKHFPGYFPVGDTRRLAELLLKSESNAKFYRRLKRHCAALSYLVQPKREFDAWRRLLRELGKRKIHPTINESF
jgi:glycosyltransferase involved in cell wall biosynthesis